ncbi:hypothetical protein MKX03_033589, partial [Papaver bracteatum]
MHLNHAIANNKYNVLLNPILRRNGESSYYRVDFDASSSSSLTYKAIEFDCPCRSDKRICHAFIGSCN